MGVRIPRLVIAGLSGDAGKTIVSLSLIAAIRKSNRVVSAFKKGPDYIDAAWLGYVAGSTCYNLDTYLVAKQQVRDSFVRHAQQGDIVLVEGNRGLFDGKDVQGSHSTAELAKLLQAPVVLVVDATKTTRTIAAIINGCRSFDKDVTIAGVILNRVGGKRHQNILKESIAKYCHIPVLGCLPKLGNDDTLIPGRHLGLVTPAEFESGKALTGTLLEIAEKYLDIEGLLDIANNAPELEVGSNTTKPKKSPSVRLGYFRDEVFTFYYPENLEALETAGAELVPISSLEDTTLPDIHGLYIGGGFPETNISLLLNNRSLMTSVREQSKTGLPIYAECGGLIYLCHSLAWKGNIYPMAGVFKIDLELFDKPVGHGYTELLVDTLNPFYEEGTCIKGHEFHYSGVVSALQKDEGCMLVKKGVGLGNGRDGLVAGNTLASYVHIHADGLPEWAQAFVRCATAYKELITGEKKTATKIRNRTKSVWVQAMGLIYK